MKKFLKRLELQSQEALHGTGYFCLIQLLTAHQFPTVPGQHQKEKGELLLPDSFVDLLDFPIEFIDLVFPMGVQAYEVAIVSVPVDVGCDSAGLGVTCLLDFDCIIT